MPRIDPRKRRAYDTAWCRLNRDRRLASKALDQPLVMQCMERRKPKRGSVAKTWTDGRRRGLYLLARLRAELIDS